MKNWKNHREKSIFGHSLTCAPSSFHALDRALKIKALIRLHVHSLEKKFVPEILRNNYSTESKTQCSRYNIRDKVKSTKI